MNILGVIPARGGSKSIPRKNLKPLGGVPLVVHVLRTAQESQAIDRLVVSTEDAEIAGVCRNAGAEIVERPAELAADETPTLPVLQHAVRCITERGFKPDAVMTLQATYPFITTATIGKMVEALRKSDADSATSVRPIPWLCHPFNARTINPDGTISFAFPEEKTRMPNRQSAPPFYAFGNVVISRTATLMEGGSIFGARSIPVVIGPEEAHDIDDPLDLEIAEFLFGRLARKS